MARKTRIPKTLDRKLRDLDDHLYFLKESLFKILNGENAYLKTLAVELRVLVCRASGTEGLLWRVIDEMRTHDAVHVHLAGNLDRDHPLAKGLQFSFVPIFRAGQGDPRLSPNHYSLKSIMKECEALVVSGDGYTHENLIRAVAEQMGSAHEDEGVEPHLIELCGTVISDQSALNSVLISEADLVLEVGERILSEGGRTVGFIKRKRPEIVIPCTPVKAYLDSYRTDFETDEKPLPREGTVVFQINHPNTDWKINSHGYKLELKQGALFIRTFKHPDKTIEVHVEGLEKDNLSIRKTIPASKLPGLMVGITWCISEVVFYLDGERVDVIGWEN
ncbi:MAG TPA: hypothetical protein PKK23_05935 [Nitrospirales bacterium]|nr:hypothetical protein [Nitrospirales bacterium]